MNFVNSLIKQVSLWYGGAEIWRIVAAFVVLLAVLLVRRLVTVYVIKRLYALAKRTRFRYDEEVIEAVQPSIGGLFLVAGVYVVLQFLPLPTAPYDVQQFAANALTVAAAVLIIYAIHRLSYVAADALDAVATHSDPALRGQFRVVLRQVLSIATWIIGVLVIIQNLGYSITSLLAGLGIGGLAMALGAQETLSNFFGSLMLLTDRPFKVGDWIQVGDVLNGNVEEVGFRSTKVRAWDKTLISIPNKELAAKTIKNWSRMPKRRVKQVVGVTYDTSAEQMSALVDGIEQILHSDPTVDKDFIMVKFTDFSAYSLDVLVYYFTKAVAWADHLSARQAINLQIMKLVQQLGLEFAFPTRTLHIVKDDDEAP